MSAENGKRPINPTLVSALYWSVGLTKREAFAMAAMQGLLANPNIKEDLLYARTAVRFADELLANLEKEGTTNE